jgi:hypothetical protein
MASLDGDGSVISCVWTRDTHDLPGRLFLDGDIDLVFRYEVAHMRSVATGEVRIPLVGLLETKVMADPSDLGDKDHPTLALLLVTYLADLFDNNSNVTFYFGALHSELQVLQARIRGISQDLQHRLLFQVPDLTPVRGRGHGAMRPVSSEGSGFEVVGPSAILERAEIDQLRLALPFRMRKLPWERLYVASEDGISVLTLFDKCETRMPLLLVIITRGGVKLGAYMPTGLKVVRGYTGSGETFVFHFTPRIQVYRWSQKNGFCATISQNEISVGGGGGAAGSAIFLSDSLRKGFSSASETFDSPPLAGKHQFEVMNAEAWHISSLASEKLVRTPRAGQSVTGDGD